MKTDTIEIVTTAKKTKAGDWIADIKGYPITGSGPTAIAAIDDAADELQRFFEAYMGGPRQTVEVRMETITQKVAFKIDLEDTRQTTLFETTTEAPEADKA